MFVEEHGVDDVRQAQPRMVGIAAIVAQVGVGVGKGVAAGVEVVADDAMLDDVGDVMHVVDGDVAFVAWVDHLHAL